MAANAVPKLIVRKWLYHAILKFGVTLDHFSQRFFRSESTRRPGQAAQQAIGQL